MLNAGFQYLEQRDKDNIIVKNGVVSKKTPFATGDNNGIYDVIAEDLRWLYENTSTGGGGSESGGVGPAGKDGKSAYEIAVANGFQGSEYEWLVSLHGEKGDRGEKGDPGANGKTNYEIAVDNGFKGTEKEWLATINGANGKTNYEIAVENGFKGTEKEWLLSLKGTDGKPGRDGMNGADGKDGKDGKSAYEIAVEHGYSSSEVSWLDSLKGAPGRNGDDGKDGIDGRSATISVGSVSYTDTRTVSVINSGSPSQAVLDFVFPSFDAVTRGDNGYSAYQVAQRNGYSGTETEWLQSLKGAPGQNGASAFEIAQYYGYKGSEEDWLQSLRGINGVAATIKIGEAKIGDKLAVENVGNEHDAVINFTFPQSIGGSSGEGGGTGKDGRSAYEVAVDNGFSGDVNEWLASLHGQDGKDGKDGVDGKNGLSAYQVAINNGFFGNEKDFIDSLKGKDGINGVDGDRGASAYEIAAVNGFAGTEQQWLASLVGEQGPKGDKGDPGNSGERGEPGKAATLHIGTVKVGETPSVINAGTETDAILDITLPYAKTGSGGSGAAGVDGKSAYEIAVTNGFSGSEKEWLASLVGPAGKDGAVGADGKSAYEVAVANGFSGNEQKWLDSLKGSPGRDGTDGKNGTNGVDGKAATIRVGKVSTGDAPSISNSGTESNAVLDFVLPAGGGSSVSKKILTVKIKTSDWKDQEFAVIDEAICADSLIIMGLPADTPLEIYKMVSAACISCVWQENDSITLRAMQTVPTADITLELAVL